jgi:hypothetical protein
MSVLSYCGTPDRCLLIIEKNVFRIMFSTWNLDHVIERSRTVVPALVDAIKESNRRTVNVGYFHTLLVRRQLWKILLFIQMDLSFPANFPLFIFTAKILMASYSAHLISMDPLLSYINRCTTHYSSVKFWI